MDKIVKKIDKIVLKLKDRLATNETVHAALMCELSQDMITEFFDGERKGIFIATETRLLFLNMIFLNMIHGEYPMNTLLFLQLKLYLLLHMPRSGTHK